MKTIYDLGRPGRTASDIPAPAAGAARPWIPAGMAGGRPRLPEVDELTLVRHYTALSRENFSVDANFYPLGSCTMKYNPKLNEKAAALEGFQRLHPLDAPADAQGILALMHDLAGMLAEISGLPGITLQPAAGAHGELTGIMIAAAHFEARGERAKRTQILIPDSAHGTNPASAALCGFTVTEVKSGPDGLVDMNDFRAKLGPQTAVMMITNPNTLGLFESHIMEIAAALHANGSLLYMDGANLNAIMGFARPGDFGVDIMHFNLHKSFATPHGGGGPGSGPVGVTAALEQYLPVPVVVKRGGTFALDYDRPRSIGRVRAFYGNVCVMVRAWTYLKTLGAAGTAEVSRLAVLNANYLLARLKGGYDIPYNRDRYCMHEFVISAEDIKKAHGVGALDIAKALIDRNIHPPTVYFPLIVHEAIMIEPTETESRETLDAFVEVMLAIRAQAAADPEGMHHAPHTRPISRPDEVNAARNPVLRQEP
ncbi:MAG: aminomethyl-transferring glycine dehydrogenase subunit GcvPB [Planctomycetota bacterium]